MCLWTVIPCCGGVLQPTGHPAAAGSLHHQGKPWERPQDWCWGSPWEWAGAGTPAGPFPKGSVNPATSSCHPCGASAPAPVLPVAPRRAGTPQARGHGAGKAGWQTSHHGVRPAPSTPPPPPPPSAIAANASAAVKRLMGAGGGSGGERSCSHELAPRLLQKRSIWPRGSFAPEQMVLSSVPGLGGGAGADAEPEEPFVTRRFRRRQR